MSETKSSRAGLTRRSFLKTTGALAGSAVIAGGGVSLAIATEEGSKQASEVTMQGHCSFTGCIGCDYNVVVREGKVVNVKPMPDAPYGRRSCLRARARIQRMYSDERLKYPMKRIGERGSDQWERISWEEAIGTICEKWKAAIEDYGSKSVVFAVQASGMGGNLSMERMKLSHVLQLTTLDNSNDWAFYHGLHRVYGSYSPGAMTVPGNYPFEIDVKSARTIFLWGKNITESYLQRWHSITESQENGSTVVVIDPNFTTAASKADHWFAPRPATDPALILSMVQVILEKELHDTAYLKTHTVGPYLVREDNGKFLRMSDLGVEPTEGPVDAMGNPTVVDNPAVWRLASGEAVSCVEEDDPELEGSWVVDGVKVSTSFTLLKKHVQQYTPEAVSEMVDLAPEDIVELALHATNGPVTHMSGMGPQAYYNGEQTGYALATLVAVTGMMGKQGAGFSSDVSVLGYPMDAVGLMFPTGTFATTVSIHSLPEIVQTKTYAGKPYPEPRCLFIAGYGFVTGIMDQNLVKNEIINKIDFVACVDTTYTDSVRWSDVVLPVCMHLEGENAVPGVDNVAHYQPKVVEPLYESKTEHSIMRMIGEGMGVGEYFQNTDEEALEHIFNIPGSSFQRLKEEAPINLSPELVVCHADGVYFTPTGKVEFYNEMPTARIETGAQIDFEQEHMARFFPPLEAWTEAEAVKKYPLQLISQRSRNRFHCQGFDGKWMLEINPEPIVRMNPEDASERGIFENDYVELFNDRGHAVMRVNLDAGLRKGMMVYLKGWQESQYVKGTTSELSHLGYDPVAMSTCYYDVCADVRKWEGEE